MACDTNDGSKNLLQLANHVLQRIGMKKIECISQCNDKFFHRIYERMLGESLIDQNSKNDTIEVMTKNIQAIIDSLSEDVLGIDISHVSASSIVNKDQEHVRCLLEIFDGLLQYVLEGVDEDVGDDCDDSNLLDENHEILSDVMEEEFGKRNGLHITHAAEYGTDSVTWQSGDNSHTVVWSDVGAHSPSGESTATDELIYIARTSGNSTDELIREAQDIQKDLSISFQNHDYDGGEQKGVEKQSLNHWLTCIPSATSSDSMPHDNANELNRQKVRSKKIKQVKPVAITQQLLEATSPTLLDPSIASSILDEANAPGDDNGECISAFKDSVSTKDDSDLSISSLQVENPTQTILTSTALTSEITPIEPMSSADTESMEITDEKIEAKVCHIQKHRGPTETKSNRQGELPHKIILVDQVEGGKLQSNVDVSLSSAANSRSKQLSELSERLLKLQNEVRPHISNGGQSEVLDADIPIPVALDTQVCENTSTLHENTGKLETDEKAEQVDTVPQKKDKGKVSFQLDSHVDTYEYPLSDTEVDYSVLSSLGAPNQESSSSVLTHKEKKSKNLKKRTQQKRNFTQRHKEQDSSSCADDTTVSSQATPPMEKRYLRRDERLHKLHKSLKAEDKENKQDIMKLSNRYNKHHGKLLNQKKTVEKQSNLQAKRQKQAEVDMEQFSTSPTCRPGRPSLRLKTTSDNKYAAKLSAIYGKGSPRKQLPPTSPAKTSANKGQKRSASTSPVARRRLKTTTPLVLEENQILPLMEEEFPFLHLSPHTAKLMWQKQLRQVGTLRKYGQSHKSLRTRQTIEDAYKKQSALTTMMKKEIEHNRRLKELKERQEQDTVVKRNLKERRQRSARARRYYNEYAVQNKARMLKKRTKEEKIFKQLFEDGLEIQKQRINEMRAYAREQKEKNAKKQQDELDSLENFYKDKFACLAESVAQEKQDLQLREKSQKQVLNKMRTNMRQRMETDLRDIQEQLNTDEDSCFFRQLDADVLKKEFQLATYKASKLK